ncbi:MBL fold metallo-hydrolase [Actinomyces lilanjuaniae]|uniref:MBL fold metallo-hydrolase n=1 Tax=Actinomyces lilanjuaniae TaxID=2321394 RepID=A0ABN5PRE4_9ACTO|nr:MBL fold metallo-hydrolase [Actinomyces lilanjuaniae]
MRAPGVRAAVSVSVHPLRAQGVFATYGYFVVEEETGRAVLVDPGAQAQLFLAAVAEHGWTVEVIALTHGHFDHVGAVEELRDALGVPAVAHVESQRYLADTYLNLSARHGLDVRVRDVGTFDDGEHVALAAAPGAAPGVELEVLHVPGHTDDSCAFYCEQAGVVLVGDTVYEGGPGLTIFPTGDARRLRESLETRLLGLPGQTVLLSGHSAPTTVARLRRALGLG